MKTIGLGSGNLNFQMLIPEDWFRSLLDDLNFALSESDQTFVNPAAKLSDSRTFVGPEGKYLNILVTPLLPHEAEPGLKETGEYFAGLAEKYDMTLIKAGTIKIADTERFWAVYYRGKLYRGGPIHYFKKYVLYQDRVEYLLTAFLWAVLPGQPLPTDEMLLRAEKSFDEMVSSIEWIPGRGPATSPLQLK